MEKASHPNRRSSPRVSVSLPVELCILQPEHTFTPEVHKALATDLSEGGCKMRCSHITRDEYQRLLHGIRLAKVAFQFGEDRRVDTRGAIVWIDYHDARGITPSYCSIGISFAFTPAALKEEIAKLQTGTGGE